MVEHEDQTDRYVRAQKVNDSGEGLQYKVRVSLSEKSFNDYKENFHKDEDEAVYF